MTTSRLNPYLSFKDNARQAMEFYKTVFGGELTLSTFGDGGMAHTPTDNAKIMHGQLVGSNGYWLMGSDTPSDMEMRPNGAVSLSGDDEASLKGYWDKLSAGATIAMPLEKAPWGDSFGMLIDKFGVSWMVNIAGTPRQ